MEHMAAMMDRQIEGAACENERLHDELSALRAKADQLADALEAMLEIYDDGVGRDWELESWKKSRAALAAYRT